MNPSYMRRLVSPEICEYLLRRLTSVYGPESKVIYDVTYYNTRAEMLGYAKG